MGLLTKDAIFAARDTRTEDVDVPEWGGTVRVKAITALERDAYEAAMVESQKNGRVKVSMRNARARLAVMACVDDTGAPLFTDADVPMLSTKSAAALDRIFAVASRLAGLSDADKDDLAGN